MKLVTINKQIITIMLVVLIVLPVITRGQNSEGSSSLAFTIPEIALLDIEPSGISNITLSLTTDTESGLPVTAAGAVNSDLWINYTSCLATGSNNRSVTVQIASGTVPNGVTLTLQPSAYSGSGQGSTGTPTGPVTLSATPQVLINAIGRCYTGNGPSNGHRLNYSLSISDYSALRYDASSTIQIAFTLTDN